MKAHRTTGALAAAALAVAALGVEDIGLGIVREIAGPHFGTRSLDVFVIWLVESGPGSKHEFLSVPCYVEAPAAAMRADTAELTPPAGQLVAEPELEPMQAPAHAELSFATGSPR